MDMSQVPYFLCYSELRQRQSLFCPQCMIVTTALGFIVDIMIVSSCLSCSLLSLEHFMPMCSAWFHTAYSVFPFSREGKYVVLLLLEFQENMGSTVNGEGVWHFKDGAMMLIDFHCKHLKLVKRGKLAFITNT